MLNHDITSAPKLYARIGGALYLSLIVFGIAAEAIRDTLLVSGNAMATAANIRSMEWLWRLGILAEFLGLICATVLAAIYYFLLRPVSRELNLIATFLRMIAIAVQAIAVLSLVAALLPLGSAAYLKAFTPEQLQATASLAIRSYGYGYALALLLFGGCFQFHGYLIARSGFLPKVLGILIMVAGLCYMTNSVALFVAPAFQDRIFPFVLLPSFVGELSLCLWLLIAGVNEPRWKALAQSHRG